MLPGPVMEEQALEVQYSDTTPYIRLICSKNDIAANKHKTHQSRATIWVKQTVAHSKYLATLD